MKKEVKKTMDERKKALLALLKKGGETKLIEREVALLATDVVLALQTKAMAKEGSRYFRDVEFSMSGTTRKKLSEEARDIINEMLILDEMGEAYGPNLTLAFDLAQKIIGGQGQRVLASLKSSRSAIA